MAPLPSHVNAPELTSSDPVPGKRALPTRHPAAAPGWHLPCLLLFLASLGMRLTLTITGRELPPAWRWADGAFWFLAAATSVAGLARWMPAQNALAAGGILGGFGALVEMVGTGTGFPFGQYEYTQRLGYKIVESVPWPVLFYWIAILLNSRGVARLVLRPWRRTEYYGFWVIFLSAFLSTWLALGAEPFFVHAAVYKNWTGRASAWNWHSVPWTFFLAWPVVSALALAFVTPWLVLKAPLKAPSDYHPLVVWILLAVLFLAGGLLWQCWNATLSMAFALPLVGMAAIRGRRYQVAASNP